MLSRTTSLSYCCCLLILSLVASAEPFRIGLPLPGTALASPQATADALDAIRDFDASYVRIVADWPRIAPDEKNWDCSFLDKAVLAAVERHLNVILVFGQAPRWAVKYLGPNPTVEEVSRAQPDLKAYRLYVDKITRRYQQRVKIYQLWERPSPRTLLACSRDVQQLYQAGAETVHTVNPSLRVIAVESGEADLSWTADYLRGAQGLRRADILSLAPIRPFFTPGDLAWHVQLLRQRVLPVKNAPTLWLEATLESPTLSLSLSRVSIAFLNGISTVMLTSASPGGTPGNVTKQAAHFLSGLLNQESRGYARLSSNILYGVLSGKENKVLILSSGDNSITFHPRNAPPPSSSALRATGDSIKISQPEKEPQSLDILEVVDVPVHTGDPMIVTGVEAPTITTSPDMNPVPVRTQSVSLDYSGSDPAGIHALRNLPGGRYSIYHLQDGHTTYATGRDTDPWIYLDIPDGFLFYNIERIPLEITVQVYGSPTHQRDGFSFYYDALGGMRNSPWQWIDTGPRDIFSYTFRLNDAIFADREGYDLRLDMGGSDNSVRLVGITVKKLLPSGMASDGKR